LGILLQRASGNGFVQTQDLELVAQASACGVSSLHGPKSTG
jgi:hypothetical protein